MDKAVVTGGEGFIGRHLVEGLRAEGFEALAFDAKTGGDITDAAALDRAFAGARFVFHLAALPRVQYSLEHPIETNKVNVEGTLKVLEAARKAGVARVIFSSSSSVYGDAEEMPLREDMPARPKSPYALHKYIGERYCQLYAEAYGLPTVCLRYFNVYGPGDSLNGSYTLVITRFLEQRKKGEPLTITGDGEQTRDFTHVRDVVRANLLAARSPKVGKGEVLNIGAGAAASVNTIAALVGGERSYVEARLEPRHTLADNGRAKEFLGWEPTVRLEAGVAELKRLAGL